MRRVKRWNLTLPLAIVLALAWSVADTPVFGQRTGRDGSRGDFSSRDIGASRSRGMSGGASTSRSNFNSTGRSLGSPGGIGRGTVNLTPSVRNPAPRSNTIVPEVRRPEAQSKTIVPNLRNLPPARTGLSANDRSPSRDFQTFPSRRIVLPPRGKEQPAVHASPPSLSQDRSAVSKSLSPSFRVYPLRDNAVSRNDGVSARPDPASSARERSAEWHALAERIKSQATQGQTPSMGITPSPRSGTEKPFSRSTSPESKDRLSDWRSSLANRADISSRVENQSSTRDKTPPSADGVSTKHHSVPPAGRGTPSDNKGPSAGSSKQPANITPYRSIFKPRTDSPGRGTPHGGSSHDRAEHRDGPPGGSSHDGPFHGGVDQRGTPHGTPRHDYRMHGTLDRHSLYPGHYYYGRYGYGYRGSSFSIYLGSPLYSSNSYYYDEPYYGVPYYVPYAVPVPAPYVVETEVVETEAPLAPVVQNGAVIAAMGGAAEFQLQAERAFQDHRYEDAARLSNHAIVEDSQNGKLHLFASQTFFALEDYASAAAAVQQAASLLDRSEWGFVVEHYQEFYRGNDYVTQMARLDNYIEQNPDAPYAYFLRGYHFLFLGHEEAARDDLAMAVELESRDVLAAELLKMAGGQVPDAASEQPSETHE